MLWECLCGLVMAERRVGGAPWLRWASVVGPNVSPPQHKDSGGAGQWAAPGACVQPAPRPSQPWEGGPPALGSRELRCWKPQEEHGWKSSGGCGSLTGENVLLTCWNPVLSFGLFCLQIGT